MSLNHELISVLKQFRDFAISAIWVCSGQSSDPSVVKDVSKRVVTFFCFLELDLSTHTT